MIYVYAIAERGEAPPIGPGLGGAVVERVVEGPLAAFVSGDAPASVEPSGRALWEHETVVEDLMDAGPVLPMRFGSTVRDEGALRDVLAEHAYALERSLERVRGRVELGVRALGEAAAAEPRDEAAAGAGTGRRYLLDKLARRRAAARVVDELHPCLAELSVASTRRVLPAEGVVFAGAYLVDRGYVPEFERRAERLDRDHTELELVCTGPWPPYNFTRDDGDE